MQNEIMNSASFATRTIEQITADIRIHAQYAAMSIYAIGQDLIDAKEQLQHGQWLPWLREVGIAPKTAENYMRIAREVTPNSTLASMPYSKALALLDVPAEQRETFIQENNVSERSAAAIKKLIKEKQAAEERAAEAEKCADEVRQQLQEERSKPEQVVEKTVHVEVEPPDYSDLKEEVKTLRRRAEEAEDAAAEAEERANNAVAQAQRAQMEQLDNEESDDMPDGKPSLTDYINICNEFTSKVWSVPYMLDIFRDMPADTLQSYRLFTNGIKSWAERVLAAIDEAKAPLTVEGVIILDDDE